MSAVRLAAPGTLAIALAVAAWALASRYAVDPRVLPPPDEVARATVRLLASGDLVDAVGASLGRIAVGYLIGALAGAATGLVLGGVRAADVMLGPLFEFLKGLPPIALVPLAIMWFGIGETPKYLIIAYVVWVVVAVNTAVGVREIPLLRVRAGQFLGLSAWERFIRIVAPSAGSYLLLGLRSAIGFAFIALVSAELVASNSGLGYLIMDSRFSLQTTRMIVALLTLSVLGALAQAGFDAAVGRSRRLSKYWRQ